MTEYNGKTYYTAKEYAERVGKSRQTINNWVNSGRLSGFIQSFGGVTHISEDALVDPAAGDGSVVVPDTPASSSEVKPESSQSKPEASQTEQDFTAYLLAEIDRLRAELETKESVIADLRGQLDAHADRLASITEESQRIAKQALETAGNAQKLQAVSMLPPPDPVPVPEEDIPESEPQKRGLFRLFHK